jgi:hypothetical protein
MQLAIVRANQIRLISRDRTPSIILSSFLFRTSRLCRAVMFKTVCWLTTGAGSSRLLAQLIPHRRAQADHRTSIRSTRTQRHTTKRNQLALDDPCRFGPCHATLDRNPFLFYLALTSAITAAYTLARPQTFLLPRCIAWFGVLFSLRY